MAAAQDEGLHIIGMMETDPQFGVADLTLERERAMTGGDGGL